jgi:hypothetical protein
MATFQFLSILAALSLTPPVKAVDLSAINRSLSKEPAYQTRLPKYCLLVFGLEARTRVWLVLDGNALYLDRNGNGDLTEAGECVQGKASGKWLEFQAGPIHDADGKRREVMLRIRDFQVGSGKCNGMMIMLDGKRKQFVGFDGANPFQFGQRRQQAPVIHVEGPLVMKLYGELPTLIAGQEVDLNISIGTPGVGPGSFCAIQCCTVLNCKVSPVAVIEYPSRDGKQAGPQARIAISDD